MAAVVSRPLASPDAKPAQVRDTAPLFNSKCFARHNQPACATIWRHYQADALAELRH